MVQYYLGQSLANPWAVKAVTSLTFMDDPQLTSAATFLLSKYSPFHFVPMQRKEKRHNTYEPSVPELSECCQLQSHQSTSQCICTLVYDFFNQSDEETKLVEVVDHCVRL